MSNVLIIKLGSLGDLIQSNGAIKDIKTKFNKSKVFLLTSKNYADLMYGCPYLDGVLIDKRLPRWNLFYLFKLKKLLESYNITEVFDLQNSKRTYFYRKYFLKNSKWSSTEEALNEGQKKSDFDKDGVLERMEIQLKRSGVNTNFTNKIDITWMIEDVSRLINQHTNREYIMIFPFCSKKHKEKKWPYYKDLIINLKQYYKNNYSIIIAPGPGEIEEAKSLNAKIVMIDDKPINIRLLTSLIFKAKYIISNDTGPAHICSHLNKKGLALFGSHTSSTKVSIGSENFKTINVEDLRELEVATVMERIKKNLN